MLKRFPYLLNPKEHLRVGHQHSQFWLILAHFMDYYLPFVVPKQFPLLLNPKVRLRVGHQHSQLWLILARFVEYYSPFWGPEAISIVVEPQGVLTCRSSTLIVLANSGPFRGLLLTVLGSRSDFHD